MIPTFPFRLALFASVVCIILLLGIIASAPAQARMVRPSSGSSIPASQVLNSDGTLNLQKGVNSSIDLAGWNVSLDPQRGPVIASSDPTTDGWSSLDNGVTDNVSSIAIIGSDVYVGGSFQQICGDLTCDSGNLSVNHIAKWSTVTNSWLPVGNGVNNVVHALAVSDSNLYVGGDFTAICGNAICDASNLTVNGVAKWNGISWSALGYGVKWLSNTGVEAVAVSGSDIYIGGWFTKVCGDAPCETGNTTVNYVAKWNGSSWAALNYGLYGGVRALAVSGNDVYAGGSFSQVCGDITCTNDNQPARAIAKWSSVSNSWSTLGFGMDNAVLALAVNGNNVYTGGYFAEICGNIACDSGNILVNQIAKWDGTSWSAVGYGLGKPNGGFHRVDVISINGNDLYAGGFFPEICGNITCDTDNTPANNIARWNGTSWSTVSNGVNSEIHALGIDTNQLFLGGYLTKACGNPTCTIGNIRVNYITQYGSCVMHPANSTLKSPTNNSIISTIRPKLKWNVTNCSDTYNVTIRDAITGKKVDTKQGLTKLQYKTIALTHGKTYQWFVQACNTYGCAKSKVFKFTVQ